MVWTVIETSSNMVDRVAGTMTRLGWACAGYMAAFTVGGGVANASSDLVTIGVATDSKGSFYEVAPFTKVETFSVVSQYPLATGAGVPGPASSTPPSGSYMSVTTAGGVVSLYNFALTGTDLLSVPESVIADDDDSVEHDVRFTGSAGDPAAILFEANLPTLYEPGVAVTSTQGPVTAYGPAFYDTADFTSYDVRYASGDDQVKYSATIYFDDPVLTTQIDKISLSGNVNVDIFSGLLAQSSSYTITGGTGVGAFDISGRTSGEGVVPEPSAYGLMIVGIGAAGTALRDRRREIIRTRTGNRRSANAPGSRAGDATGARSPRRWFQAHPVSRVIRAVRMSTATTSPT